MYILLIYILLRISKIIIILYMHFPFNEFMNLVVRPTLGSQFIKYLFMEILLYDKNKKQKKQTKKNLTMYLSTGYVASCNLSIDVVNYTQ